MNTITQRKRYIAIFMAGFLTNYLIMTYLEHKTNEKVENFKSTGSLYPVNPDDFDQSKMMDAIERMQKETESGFSGLEKDLDEAGNVVGAFNQHEDDKYVYYEIPLKGQDGANHKLNVEIKNGLVKVTEDTKNQGAGAMSESSSERMFSLDPRQVDADKAEVLNQKDKIVIKIPKRH